MGASRRPPLTILRFYTSAPLPIIIYHTTARPCRTPPPLPSSFPDGGLYSVVWWMGIMGSVLPNCEWDWQGYWRVATGLWTPFWGVLPPKKYKFQHIRVNWEYHVGMLEYTDQFKQRFCMSWQMFDDLVDELRVPLSSLSIICSIDEIYLWKQSYLSWGDCSNWLKHFRTIRYLWIMCQQLWHLFFLIKAYFWFVSQCYQLQWDLSCNYDNFSPRGRWAERSCPAVDECFNLCPRVVLGVYRCSWWVVPLDGNAQRCLESGWLLQWTL